MKAEKQTNIRIYVALALTGLLILVFWPSLVVAMPLTAKPYLEQTWNFAGNADSYQYHTAVMQTIHPTARLENVGRANKTERIDVEGQMDRVLESMQMRLWPKGKTSQRMIELKVEDGLLYGRINADDPWAEVENSTLDLFAPGGDPLGFLVAAENIQEVGSREYEVGGDEQFPYSLLPTPYSLLLTPE